MTGQDDRWTWLADHDFDGEEPPDEPPDLPPGWHIVAHRGVLRLTCDLPDISTYQPST